MIRLASRGPKPKGSCVRLSPASQFARLLEREGICEQCHKSYGTELFDRKFVCSPCRRALEEKLVNDG